MSKALNIMWRVRTQACISIIAGCASLLLESTYAASPKKPANTDPATTAAPAKKNTAEPTAAVAPADKTPKPAAAEKPAPPAVSNEVVPPPPGVPPVLLTKQDANLCRVKVGDALPAIELPKADDAKKMKLSDLYGKAATVVVFWADDRRMSHMEMADLAADVIEPFGSKGVAVVGVAVKEKPDLAAKAVKEVGKQIPMLVDEKGTAFAQIGSRRLPRTFVLDANGTICWFDIEYSHATRRELKQALAATVH
jgi:peroxiredoxin